MIVKPKVRGFVCITAHPDGCARNVEEQIALVRKNGVLANCPKKVLVLGASTGYGLSSRIAAAFGGGAATLGVFFERPSNNGRPASAGWYNSVAFEAAARASGIYAGSINGDAFSAEIRTAVIERIRKDLGSVDCVIFSLAAPRRTDPVTNTVYKSCLKPIGSPFSGKNLDTDKSLVNEVTIEPATDEEIIGTEKVMGGEPWAEWLHALRDSKVLDDDAISLAYSYIGPELTYPIYHEGTIGRAKAHLDATAAQLRAEGINARVSVNKAVVTQASSAIPVVPLYISILFKVMKEKGLHEGCIEQIDRLFRSCMDNPDAVDPDGRIRIDDLEMRSDVQEAVNSIWPNVTTENLRELTDYDGYQQEFLRLFGFGLPGVDYSEETEIDRPLGA